MNLDPVQYQNRYFESADHTLAFCRETFASLGLTEEAQRVQLSVTDCGIARSALMTLAAMNLRAPKAREAWASAVYALRGALASCGALGTA